MTLFENPFATLRELEQLHLAHEAYEARLAQGEIDPTGPFIGKPSLTARDAFLEIREAQLPPPLKQAWLRWAWLLSDARVNAPTQSALAHAYRCTTYLVEWKDPLHLTLSHLVGCVLGRRGERQFFLDALASHSNHYSRLVQLHWARRKELARRAGFEHLDAIESPTPQLEELARELLTHTQELYAQTVPRDVEGFFETALATQALSGWPAKLSRQSLELLLGSREFLRGLALRDIHLTPPLAPASYFRALRELGRAMVDASPSRSQPFVVARDPYGLFRQTLGSLLARLPASATFNLRNRNLSRTHAHAQARAFALSELIDTRLAALGVLLRAKLLRREREFTGDFEELSAEALGFALPPSLAGLLPRLHIDSGQRLLGTWLASDWQQTLIAQFDEDWFRNPRGIEAIRSSLCDPPETMVAADKARASLRAWVDQLIEQLR